MYMRSKQRDKDEGRDTIFFIHVTQFIDRLSPRPLGEVQELLETFTASDWSMVRGGHLSHSAQRFSNIAVRSGPPGALLKCRFWSSRSGALGRCCIVNKLSSDTGHMDAAGLRTTLSVEGSADTAALGPECSSPLPGLRSAVCIALSPPGKVAAVVLHTLKNLQCNSVSRTQEPRKPLVCLLFHPPALVWGSSHSNQRTFRDLLIKSFSRSPREGAKLNPKEGISKSWNSMVRWNKSRPWKPRVLGSNADSSTDRCWASQMFPSQPQCSHLYNGNMRMEWEISHKIHSAWLVWCSVPSGFFPQRRQSSSPCGTRVRYVGAGGSWLPLNHMHRQMPMTESHVQLGWG